jgi:hypothetical protein
MFLAPVQVPKEDVPLPEFGEGCVIPVWGMTARERTLFEKGFTSKTGKTIEDRVKEFRERLVLACCKNDDGIQLFTPEDISRLGDQRADILERIVNAAQRLSGMTNADIEETVKNSAATQPV